MTTIQCYSCQHIWDAELPMGRRDECPKCYLDAKVCLNCRFYDAHSYHECVESQADWVEDKNKGNFCDYFVPLAAQSLSTESKAKEDAALAAFFGEKSPQPSKTSRLEDEFSSFVKKKKD